MIEIGDRAGQIEVLIGLAKTMILVKNQDQADSVCECQVLFKFQPIKMGIHL